jgi:DNA-binding NtrC family response regulator
VSDCRVLLVDDEVEFVVANSGLEALEAAETTGFDAIVLDMAMPGMNGIETLEKLLEINQDLQVILLTGQATLEQAATAIRVGALDLLEKPADLDTLVAKIELAATRKWSLDEKRIEERVADIMRKKGW